MKIIDVYNFIEKIVPLSLSKEFCEKYDAYDNSGLLINCGKDTNKILFSLDLSENAVNKAIAEKANLIITHHPVIYSKIKDIRIDSIDNGKNIIKCINNSISVISMHLNLDAIPGGIDDSLMNAIKVSSKSFNDDSKLSVMCPLSIGGYGKVYTIGQTTLNEICDNLKKVLNTKKIFKYENGKNVVINRIASFCGAGADEEAVRYAVSNGADLLISSDFKHHILTMAMENGLSILQLTHYASENWGFNQFYKKICGLINLPCVYNTDEIML